MIIYPLKEEGVKRPPGLLCLSINLVFVGDCVMHSFMCSSYFPNVEMLRYGSLGTLFLQFDPDNRFKEKTGQLHNYLVAKCYAQ